MLLLGSGTGLNSVTGLLLLDPKSRAQYWTLVLDPVQAGWSLTFLHYPSRWLGTGGTVEQTAGCHSAGTASQFAVT